MASGRRSLGLGQRLRGIVPLDRASRDMARGGLLPARRWPAPTVPLLCVAFANHLPRASPTGTYSPPTQLQSGDA